MIRSAALLLTALVAMQHAQSAQPAVTTTVLAGKVIKVIDGDTMDVQLSSGKIRVRMHGVDAPESDQPGGAAATTWLAQELNNQQITLEPVSQDQYDRMVAIVRRDDRNMNRELLQTGHGWAYRHFMRRIDEDLCKVEERARLKGTGIWATTANPPWEYRDTKGKGPFTSYAGTTARDCSNAIGRKLP